MTTIMAAGAVMGVQRRIRSPTGGARSLHRRSLVVSLPPGGVSRGVRRLAAFFALQVGGADDVGPAVLTFEDVQDRAKAAHNLTLRLNTIGPFFKLTCHHAEDSQVVLGETDGFVVPPLRILHVDSMRIYNSRLKKLKQNVDDHEANIGIMGLGRVLAKAIAAHGFAVGCVKAEILAINDDDETHRKLVMYYKRLGFKPVREVTGGLADLPHMLVWGGVGTRMDADIEAFIRILKI